METGLHKLVKTKIVIDEASSIVEIRTHNKDLKNRLTKYAADCPRHL